MGCCFGRPTTFSPSHGSAESAAKSLGRSVAPHSTKKSRSPGSKGFPRAASRSAISRDDSLGTSQSRHAAYGAAGVVDRDQHSHHRRLRMGLFCAYRLDRTLRSQAPPAKRSRRKGFHSASYAVGADLLAVLVAVLAGLYYFGINPNATLAGLGVGGIAVALAAQRALENVIAGASLIFDGAVRVGDLLKVGETLGTVEDIGLRSTRLRTFDRTVFTVPNGQIANVSLENLSLRDSFWFHHIFRLRYETTAAQMRSVLQGITGLLEKYPLAKHFPMPVRFLRLSAYSLDVEIFAHLAVPDWAHFLELQGQLLLQIMEVIETQGAQLALPAQIAYLAVSSDSNLSSVQALFDKSGLHSSKQNGDSA